MIIDHEKELAELLSRHGEKHLRLKDGGTQTIQEALSSYVEAHGLSVMGQCSLVRQLEGICSDQERLARRGPETSNELMQKLLEYGHLVVQPNRSSVYGDKLPPPRTILEEFDELVGDRYMPVETKMKFLERIISIHEAQNKRGPEAE